MERRKGVGAGGGAQTCSTSFDAVLDNGADAFLQLFVQALATFAAAAPAAAAANLGKKLQERARDLRLQRGSSRIFGLCKHEAE